MNLRIFIVVSVLLWINQKSACQVISTCISQKFEMPNFKNPNEASLNAYFIGINEGVSTNFELLPLQIEYFVQLGVKFVVIERSYADSYLYNEYLKTGDEKNIEGDVSWSEDMKRCFNKIYSFNLTLPKEKKIEFIGIDAPNYLGSIVKTLGKIFQNSDPPIEIKPLVDSIKMLSKYPLYHFWREIKTYNESFVNYIKNQVELNDVSFNKFLGEDYFHLNQIVENRASHFRPGDRNKDMYSNLIRIFKSLPAKSSLFVFGSTHVSRDFRGSLGSRVYRDSDSPFLNRVQIINSHYENCRAFYAGKDVKIDQSILDFQFKKNKIRIIKKIKGDLECTVSIYDTNNVAELNSLHSDFDYLLLVEAGQPIIDLRKKLLQNK
jgi:hypothetical protein